MAEGMSRRKYLKYVGSGLVGLAVGGGIGAIVGQSLSPAKEVVANPREKIFAGVSERSVANPYGVGVVTGGEQLAKYLGLGGYTSMTFEGNSEVQLSQIESWISGKGKGNCILYINPNEDGIVRPIAELCYDTETYLWVEWNKPVNLHPDEFQPYWVAFRVCDGFDSGYLMAKQLFEGMKKKTKYPGNICVIRGMLGNAVEYGRFMGLKKALEENPEVTVLGGLENALPADWNMEPAMKVMEQYISAFGANKIHGVWAANDAEGLGAYEACKAAGIQVPITGTDAIPEFVKAIIEGKVWATASADPQWQSATGLLACYLAKEYGWKPPMLEYAYTPPVVNPDNAQEYYDKFFKGGLPERNWFAELFYHPSKPYTPPQLT